MSPAIIAALVCVFCGSGVAILAAKKKRSL